MLVLSRKHGESVVLGGNIVVTVIAVQGNKVRLGFKAPDDVVICREEICFGPPVCESRERPHLAPITAA